MHVNDYQTLLLSVIDNNVLQVTMNRPESANAFNTQMAQELYSLFEDLSLDSDGVRVIIVTGAGRTCILCWG